MRETRKKGIEKTRWPEKLCSAAFPAITPGVIILCYFISKSFEVIILSFEISLAK